MKRESFAPVERTSDLKASRRQVSHWNQVAFAAKDRSPAGEIARAPAQPSCRGPPGVRFDSPVSGPQRDERAQLWFAQPEAAPEEDTEARGHERHATHA